MSEWSTCALCPRLCRSACPVTTGSGREASVPGLIAAAMLEIERGTLPAELSAEVLTLCTDCGACQEHCHLHLPLPERIRRARIAVVPRPPVEPLNPIEGAGSWVAVESDGRPLAEAISRKLSVGVRRWKTADDLGVASLDYPGFDARAPRIREAVGQLDVVVISGGVARVLEAAGVGFQWLHQVVRGLPSGEGSCVLGRSRPLACCGGAGPLMTSHPSDARRVGATWLARSEEWVVGDARCKSHLDRCGGQVQDPLDALLAAQR